ncbi:hypothetical protein AX16_005976 [Volvariella volvacea WC 439]|nr:hypothetical protein AX16_005976 [Volvariella volvacea WC 439]
MLADELKYIAAPMVKQSDLPFRILTRKYGATLAYTQMLIPHRLLNDQDYLEFHLRDLTSIADGDSELVRPVVVQLCGNDPEAIVQAGRKVQSYCDGIDLNLGCPQEAARDGHYGAYLLGQKDWPLLSDIVSAMKNSFIVPVSTKLRLCQPSSKTVDLAEQLQNSGASWITLHARTVSARRRRQGAADLSQVKVLKERLTIPVISNGNIRGWSSLQENLDFTGADGLMVGEPLLDNPCVFANVVPDPVDISLEYLEICKCYPGVVSLPIIQTHIRHFVEYRCGRRPWFTKFRTSLSDTSDIAEISHLLRYKVQRWRGKAVRKLQHEEDDEGGNTNCGDNSIEDEEASIWTRQDTGDPYYR